MEYEIIVLVSGYKVGCWAALPTYTEQGTVFYLIGVIRVAETVILRVWTVAGGGMHRDQLVLNKSRGQAAIVKYTMQSVNQLHGDEHKRPTPQGSIQFETNRKTQLLTAYCTAPSRLLGTTMTTY